MKVYLYTAPSTKDLTDEKFNTSNFQRLAALDRLSLYFCLGADHDTTIEGVPMSESGEEADWELRSAGANEFTLDPYPFRSEPLEFALLAQRIPRRRFMNDSDLQSDFSAAPFFPLKITLCTV